MAPQPKKNTSKPGWHAIPKKSTPAKRKFFDVRPRIEGERGELIDRFITYKMDKENRATKTDTVSALLLECAKEWERTQ